MNLTRSVVPALTALAAALFLAGCQETKQDAVSLTEQTSSSSLTQTADTTVDRAAVATSEPSPAPSTAGQTPTPAPPSKRTPDAPTSSEAPATPSSGSVATPAGSEPAASRTSQPVTLQFAFSPGQKVTFKSKTTSTQRMKQAEDAKPTTSTSKADLKVEVKAVKDGKATVDISVAALHLEGGDQAQKKAMTDAAKQIKGATITNTFDKRGQGGDPKVTKGSLSQVMAAGISSTAGFFGIIYPENPVTVGDSWRSTMDFEKMMKVALPMPNAKFEESQVPVNFRLESVDLQKGTALLTFTMRGVPVMTMTINPPKGKDGKPTGEPQTIRSTFDIRTSGRATVDLKTGLPRSIEYDGKIGIDGLMGMSMEQTVKTVMTRA